MGSAVEIKLQEINALKQKLDAFMLSGGDKTGLLNSLGLVIEEQSKERFDTQRDPEGNEWRKWTAKYSKYLEKNFPAASLLVREGFLRQSIEHQINGSDSVLVGSPMEYADYIQNAKSENRRRQFLGFSTENIAELQNAVDEFMKEKVA